MAAELTALEFYSGIGGMRYALDAATRTNRTNRGGHRVLAAFDLNPVANAVYEHNFGVRPIQGNLGACTPQPLCPSSRTEPAGRQWTETIVGPALAQTACCSRRRSARCDPPGALTSDSGFRQQSVTTPTGRERMSSPTVQRHR